MNILKNAKTLSLLLMSFSLLFLFSCSSDDNSPKDGVDTEGYDVVAHLEFDTGEVMDYKANNVVPVDEPFVYDENTGHRIMTATYQIIKDDLIYRFSIKGIFKDEPGSYTMYESEDDNLEALGFYMDFTINSVYGTGTTYHLYRTQYVSRESGQLEITSVTEDRLKGNFSAVLPYMPLANGGDLEITNGKIDIVIQRITLD